MVITDIFPKNIESTKISQAALNLEGYYFYGNKVRDTSREVVLYIRNDIIQLLTIVSAEVNIGILRSISHHVQCLNSQQLFYYIISLLKQKSNNNNKILAMDYVLDSLEFLFLQDD